MMVKASAKSCSTPEADSLITRAGRMLPRRPGAPLDLVVEEGSLLPCDCRCCCCCCAETKTGTVRAMMSSATRARVILFFTSDASFEKSEKFRVASQKSAHERPPSDFGFL